MIQKIVHDGDVYNQIDLDDFLIDKNNDISNIKKTIEVSGKEIEIYDNRISFVGFVLNPNGDLLVSLPKHYQFNAQSIGSDCQIIFKIITKFIQKRENKYIGPLRGQEWKSNYPFSSFFGVYEYYLKHGLYFDIDNALSEKQSGKMDWKNTIKLSKKYIVNGKFLFYPFFRQKPIRVESFITMCMAYVINYTASKFNFVINVQPVGYNNLPGNFGTNKSAIVDELLRIRGRVFDDEKSALIRDLIYYFSNLNEGGSFYLKHYNFAAIWEDAIRTYVSHHFSGVRNGKIFFSNSPVKTTKFDKPRFYPNLAKPNEYFVPDCYGCSKSSQFIFDAKYYTDIDGLMYKELCYLFFLTDYLDSIKCRVTKFKKTFCALLIPFETRKTETNFKINPLFSRHFKDLIIYEEYFDIKQILQLYC